MTQAPHVIDDDMLQAYLDRELEEGEAATVAAAIAQDPALGFRLETLRLLGTGVRAAESDLDQRISASTDSDALFAAIAGRISGASVAAPAPAAAKPVLRSILGGRGARIGIGTAGFLALAAGVALMVRPPNVTLPSVPQAAVTTSLQIPSVRRGTEILNVEFGKHTGTHFALEGEAGEPIAVVWIQENEPKEARQ
jgi:hypothetical protein